MKKSLSIGFVLVLIGFYSFSQTDTLFNQTDKSGLKQGYWKKKYPNGKVAYQGYFKDDKPRGVFKRYYEGGSIKVILNWNEEGNYAKAEFFYSNGKLVVEGYFYNNQKDSLWKYYSPEKRVVFEESYKKGVKHGKYISYYKDGSTFESIPWSNGKKHGVMFQYYENGQYKSAVKYINDIQDGLLRTFFYDGKIRLDGLYKNGVKDGLWKMYNENGKLLREVKYINGYPEKYDEELERENKLLQEMFKNIGRIPEPDVEDFLQKMGGF